jgi:DivIVA domain-containing protein
MSELTPTQVVSASFKTVRKGYDPEEVDTFLERVAKSLDEAQQQATAMEARARAAVARLQELSAAAEQAPAPPPAPAAPQVAPDEAETITRTLLLAQRTADAAVAEAHAEAERILGEARTEAETTIDSTREMSARLLDEARTEARRVNEAELIAATNEVQSLVARREFLIGDVDQLEQFLVDQRERLRAAARQIEALCERVPAGLGHVRGPVLSASDDPPGDDTSEQFRPDGVAAVDIGDEAEPPTSGALPFDLDDADAAASAHEPIVADTVDGDDLDPTVPMPIIVEATDAPVLDADATPPAGTPRADDGWRRDDGWH